LLSISLIFTTSLETLAPSSYVLIFPRRLYLNNAFASNIDEAPPNSLTLYLPLCYNPEGLSIP
jgi:hypothetical protein